MKAHLSPIALAVTAFALADVALADTQTEARLREALRTATTQLRALEDERARWQASEAEQKKEIESLKQQLAAASSKARDKAASAEWKKRVEQQTEENAKLAKSLSECQAAQRTAGEAAAAKDEELARAQQTLTSSGQRLASCEEKNARLYQLTSDFVERFSHMGFGDGLASMVEPLFGSRRVQLENFAQDLQDRLSEQKVQP